MTDTVEEFGFDRLDHLSKLSPEEMLRELLAVIHRDGGHHTEKVGLAQSVVDAEELHQSQLLAYEKRNEPFTFDDKQKIEQALKKAGCKEEA